MTTPSDKELAERERMRRSLLGQYKTSIVGNDPLVVAYGNDHHEALLAMLGLCKENGWHLLVHKPNVGLLPTIAAVGKYLTTCAAEAGDKPQLPGALGGQGPAAAPPASPQAVMAAIQVFLSFDNKKGQDYVPSVLVLHNAHDALAKSVALVTAIQDASGRFKETGKTLVILTHPGATLPVELAPYYTTVEQPPPEKDERARVISGVQIVGSDDEVDEQAQKALVEATAVASAGLTRQQLETAVARCIMRHGRLVPNDVWERKVELFNRDGLVRVHRSTGGLEQLGGLHFYKDTVVKLVRKGRMLKILNAGPPGCGKSAGAFAIGHECGLPVLEANLGSLFGKFVGESEARSRQMMEIIEKNAPCVVVMDELPRYISTDTDGDDGGGNVNAKVGAEWLRWLSSPRSAEVLIVATANEWSGVGTLIRAERFDFNVYTSIQSSPEKQQAIWDIHLAAYGVALTVDETHLPADQLTWTGAEIKTLCRLASKDWLGEPVSVAADRVNFIMDSPRMARRIMDMESQGRDACLDVETGFRFGRQTRAAVEARPAEAQPAESQVDETSRPKRRVRRDATA